MVALLLALLSSDSHIRAVLSSDQAYGLPGQSVLTNYIGPLHALLQVLYDGLVTLLSSDRVVLALHTRDQTYNFPRQSVLTSYIGPPHALPEVPDNGKVPCLALLHVHGQ
ncbi:MAG: hypothetical protein F4246_05075 [Rhodothermaceae bacterium]|nr:hypothetical protein [Rhodothermaceae bacterium]